jgi:hypothetical protein
VGNGAVVRLLMPDAVCSGALWTPRVVITAGHCVTDMAGNVTNQPIQISLPGANVALSPQVIAQSATITVNGWRRVGQLSQGDDIAFLVLPMDMPGGTISRLATVAEVQARRKPRSPEFAPVTAAAPSSPKSVRKRCSSASTRPHPDRVHVRSHRR